MAVTGVYQTLALSFSGNVKVKVACASLLLSETAAELSLRDRKTLPLAE